MAATLFLAALACARQAVADGSGSASVQHSEAPREGQPDNARRLQAQRHFEKGLALARTGKNWDEALAQFLESRRLFPTRSASRNAAIALRQLKAASGRGATTGNLPGQTPAARTPS